MEMGSKPFQDQFLHPILVHFRKIRNIPGAKWGTQKILKKTVLNKAAEKKIS